jgi:hypothetical protein
LTGFGIVCPGGISGVKEPLRGPRLGVLLWEVPSRLDIEFTIGSGCASSDFAAVASRPLSAGLSVKNECVVAVFEAPSWSGRSEAIVVSLAEGVAGC